MIFDETVLIRRPQEAVFKRLTDIQEGAVQPGSPVLAMEKIPPGPTVVGTRWREVVRLTKRRSMTMWSEVTGIEPDSMLAERFWGGSMRGILIYTISPHPAGSSLRQQERLEAVGWLSAFGWAVGRMLRPRLHERLLSIRDDLEDAGTPTAVGAGTPDSALQNPYREEER
jgi:hypothetical protein